MDKASRQACHHTPGSGRSDGDLVVYSLCIVCSCWWICSHQSRQETPAEQVVVSCVILPMATASYTSGGRGDVDHYFFHSCTLLLAQQQSQLACLHQPELGQIASSNLFTSKGLTCHLMRHRLLCHHMQLQHICTETNKGWCAG